MRRATFALPAHKNVVPAHWAFLQHVEFVAQGVNNLASSIQYYPVANGSRAPCMTLALHLCHIGKKASAHHTAPLLRCFNMFPPLSTKPSVIISIFPMLLTWFSLFFSRPSVTKDRLYWWTLTCTVARVGTPVTRWYQDRILFIHSTNCNSPPQKSHSPK